MGVRADLNSSAAFRLQREGRDERLLLGGLVSRSGGLAGTTLPGRLRRSAGRCVRAERSAGSRETTQAVAQVMPR